MTKEKLCELILAVREAQFAAEEFLKKKKEEFELSITNQKKSLLELTTKKDELEGKLIELMKKENIGSLKTDEANIIHSRRITLKIVDEKKLTDYVLENATELKKLVADTVKTCDELIDLVMPRRVTATSIKVLSDRHFEINDDVLPGMQKEENNFLTIKKINE